MKIVVLTLIALLCLIILGPRLLTPTVAELNPALADPAAGHDATPAASARSDAETPARSQSTAPALKADLPPGGSEVAAFNSRAKEALERGQFGDAVALLLLAVALAPDDVVLAHNLAFAHYKVGESLMAAHDTDAARGAFRRAWELDETESAYGLHSASLLLRAFALEPTLQQLDDVLALHPESGAAHLMRGDVLNLLDRLEESLEAYQAAREHGDAKVLAAVEQARSRTERQLAVERDYISEETAYFVVRHPAGSDHLLLLGVLERARVEVCHALGAFPSHKALVVLYPPESFRTVTGTHEWVGGLFDRKIRLPIADLDSESDKIEGAFRHEFTHLMVSEWNPSCPTFVNEGLAQMMEFGRGLGLEKLVQHLDAMGIARDELPRLADLPESFVSVSDREIVSLGYLLSYAFVDHVAKLHGMGAVSGWIIGLEHAPLEQAYHAATGRTLEHEEQLLRELVRTAR